MNPALREFSGLTLRVSALAGGSVGMEVVRAGVPVATGELSIAGRAAEWSATLLLEDSEDAAACAALIEWSEVQATAMVGREVAPMARAGRAARARVLFCIDDPPETEVVAGALAGAGYTLAVAEETYSRRSTGVNVAPLPAGIELRHWGEDTAPRFYEAYVGAFRDRPGFPGWDEDGWRSVFCAVEAFRPGISMVLLAGSEAVGFAVLWVEDSSTGWVTQMGVVPGWRGKGVGEALLARALKAFESEGLLTTALEVATNNPAARGLYQRMGFTFESLHQSWRKRLA